MITKCKYMVDCDNECGCHCQGYNTKKEVKKYWYVYKLKPVNPFADEMVNISRCPETLTFCSSHCAEQYFNYWKERKSFYKKIK